MRIQLTFYGGFSSYLPPGAPRRGAPLEVGEGATVAQVLATLGVPDDLPYLVVVNGLTVDPGAPLREGDSLALFPPMVGGRAADAAFHLTPRLGRCYRPANLQPSGTTGLGERPVEDRRTTERSSSEIVRLCR